MKESICSIVVTYNRKELLIRNLESIVKQTIKTDILVFDNNSSDGTDIYIKQSEYNLMDNFFYIKSEKNIGGAGGFYSSLKWAYEQGYNWFWLMDDDGYAFNEKTLEYITNETLFTENTNCILNSLIIKDENLELSFGLNKAKDYSEILGMADKGLIYNKVNPFNGTLISRKTVEQIGFPRSDFFIWGDEVEYILRAKENKVLVATVVESLYVHPPASSFTMKKIGKKEYAINNVSAWKWFYGVRNNAYTYKKYYGIQSYKRFKTESYISAFFSKENKIKRILYTCLAIKDAKNNNFSRNIKPIGVK